MLKEDVWSPRSGVPLLVVDWKTIAHNICGLAERLPQEERHDYTKHMWSFCLNSGPMFVQAKNYRVIVVDDVKPYWREKVYVDYKGNRPAVERDGLNDVLEIGGRVRNLFNFPYFAAAGYEADDWAGEIYRQVSRFRPERSVIMWTVDSDWMQLVDDSLDIIWANVGPWRPRLRGNFEVCQWALRRLNVFIEHPREIAELKQFQGDSCDNIPPGLDGSMTSLLVMHDDYGFPQAERDRLLREIINPQHNTNASNAAMSRDTIIRNGWSLCG